MLLPVAWFNSAFDEPADDLARNLARPISLPLFQCPRDLVAKTLESLQLILCLTQMVLQGVNYLGAGAVATLSQPQNADNFLQ
jgi:hypothetical protein